MAETKFGKRIRSIRQNAECSQKEFCTTVKLNGTNFTAEIPAYVFTELMSVLLEKLEK